MLIVVTGGSPSGKSKTAERIAEKLCPSEKIYLATMLAGDGECRDRIERHRKRREGKQYRTIERGTNLQGLNLNQKTTVLLDDLSNLVANEMYDPLGVKEGVALYAVEGILHVMRQSKHLVVVANDVFSERVKYEESAHYLKILGEVQKQLAKEADIFIETVYGIDICHKGIKRYEEVLQ